MLPVSLAGDGDAGVELLNALHGLRKLTPESLGGGLGCNAQETLGKRALGIGHFVA